MRVLFSLLEGSDQPCIPGVLIEMIDRRFRMFPRAGSCHQAAKLAGWFGAYSALFSMPEMFYIEPVNELVEELTRGAVMAV